MIAHTLLKKAAPGLLALSLVAGIGTSADAQVANVLAITLGKNQAQASIQAKSDRLTEIAQALKDKKSDGVSLLTEAVRLCGFSIWNEDRTRLQEPTTTPPLNLAITDKEIAGYVELFRRGDRVAVADVVNSLDPIYRSVQGAKGLQNYAYQVVWSNIFSKKEAPKLLAVLIQELGRTHEVATDTPVGLNSQLDPIQALLVLRVLTEEMRVPIMRHNAKHPEVFASVNEEATQDEAPGWAEDAFAGGITGLFDEVVGRLGETGGKITGAVGKANALAAISKFLLTYKFLRGEITLEGKGQPLIRTKDFDAGDERTTVARFYIDGTAATDWIKENRKYFHAIGMDPDMPKSGALKGVQTFWEVDQSAKYATKQLIQAVRGTTDLSKLKTDDEGKASVTWEGKPQPKKIDPKKAMPVMKSVWIHVAPQVKTVEMQQDLVDAVMTAIGLRGGASGVLTPIMEILYRMKWHAPAHFELQVRDWVEGETIGQLTVEAKGSGNSFGKERSFRSTIDHTLTISDYTMGVSGFEQLPTFDEATLKKFPPDVRKQVEAGMKEQREQAKKRSFHGTGPGTATIKINDTNGWHAVFHECGGSQTNTGQEAWVGSRTEELKQYAGDFGFSVEANLETKVALLKFNGFVEGVHTLVSGKESQRNNRRLDMRSNIKFASDLIDGNGQIKLPLKETPLPNQLASNYHGTATIPFTFGPGNQFKGSMIVSFSVTRKMPPKEPAKPKKKG